MHTFNSELDRLQGAGHDTVNVRSMPSYPELIGCELKVLGHFNGEYSILNLTDEDSMPLNIDGETKCELF
jgi:hypothetical protein